MNRQLPMPRRNSCTSVKLPLGSMALVLALSGCGFDSPILNNFTELGPDYVQHATPYEVYGQVYGLPGAQIDFLAPTGAQLPQYTVAADGDGVFKATFPGTTEYRNLVVQATEGSSRVLGLAVRVPRNENVWERFGPYHLGGMTRIKWGDGVPLMANLDDRTTALTLILLRKSFVQGIALGSISADSMNEALTTLVQRLTTGSGGAGDALAMVRRVLAGSRASRSAAPAFQFPDATGSYLSNEFLGQVPLDYSGDGYADPSNEAFAAALDRAGEGLALSGCKAEDRITVVFQTRIGEGVKDSNCSPVNPFKFAKNEEGKTLFITGAMFTADTTAATPSCDGAKQDGCLTSEEWAEVNRAFGNWVPNKIAMRDDGQGADATAGDGIWTAAFELPYISTLVDGGRRKGVRIGYKYTYGFAGSNWGGTEEWPGNNRILELEDANGDGLVVRFDVFGDESSNKNVANVNQKLCGGNRNPWAEDAKPGCWADTQENRIDTDGDCVPDTFPAPGAVTPGCESGGDFDVEFVGQAFLSSEQPPVISSMTPGEGPNGGGFLVELKGSRLRPGIDCEVNTADSGTVGGNRFRDLFVPDPGRLYFLAPAFLAERANVTLLYSNADGSTASVKAPLTYKLAGKRDCSLLWPASVPDQGGVAGVPLEPAGPFVGRLSDVQPGYDSNVRVEVGISPACCDADETCMLPYGPCYDLPDPRYQAGWVFEAMDWDAACRLPEGAGLAECGDAVQFLGTVLPESGPARYRVAMRYSLDFGKSWDYCDLPQDGAAWGNEDGFALKNAAELWVGN